MDNPDLAKRLAGLPPEKLALLMQQINKGKPAASSAQIVSQPENTQPAPLSFAQQRLWFLDQFQTGQTVYNNSGAMRLIGPVDVAALHQSFNEIIRRHAVLRTTFIQDTATGEPVQVVAPTLQIALPVVDLRVTHPAATPAEREAEMLRLARVQNNEPFDLQRGPLIRVTLVRLDAQEHVLLQTLHHIVADAWSLGVLMRELHTLYGVFAQGGTTQAASALPPLPIQYADFARWQRAWLAGHPAGDAPGSVREQQLRYWRRQLGPAGRALPVLELPSDRPRPPVQTGAGATHISLLPRDLSDSVVALSQREGATPFMTLLAAFKVLLYRYTGRADLLVGTPIAGRTRAETEPLIGIFLNTLVLRTDLSGNPPFRELLGRVRETALDAYAHQDLPFEILVEALQPERSLSHSPIFQVMFILQNAPMPVLTARDVTLSSLRIDRDTTKFDLTMDIVQTADGLEVALEYSTDLFDAATIARMAGHFQQLLAGIVAAPEQRIDALPLMTTAELRQQLTDWNATATPLPEQRSIHQLIAEQAARTPEAVALCFEDQQLSYRELLRRADQLAHELRDRGVGPDTLVGLCVERSLELVVGALGILRAGAAYLPLDPAYPAERIAFMLADAAAPVLLTQQALRGRLPEERLEVLALDADWPLIDRPRPAPAAPPMLSPANLAYVIYTSGSTGKPKGVMVNHGNLVNFCVGMDQRIGGERPGTWLAVTSLSFDISVLELLWTLARGFRVVIQGAMQPSIPTAPAVDRAIQFSLFYFGSANQDDIAEQYRLLLEGAQFADRHGFTAIWTPERHSHAFGGIYPNPAITSAMLATVTQQIQLRAGSLVLPLDNPIRVAEDWAMIDNVSGGRVGLSFASGWHADDFVFASASYGTREEVMLRDIDTVRRLWRGEPLPFAGGGGNEVAVRTMPRPLQRELPVWLTAAGSPATFEVAGEIGANLLTHLLGQSVEELAANIAVYRAAWQAAGHAGAGHVTLMLHTFLGTDLERVRATVRAPFRDYLRTSLDLISNLGRSLGHDIHADDFTAADREALLDYAFERYFATSSLLGTPETCLALVHRLKQIGVDEIGCLIDFGVEAGAVLDSLHQLTVLKDRSNLPPEQRADYSIAAQLRRHQVSHLQCTPSMAELLLLDPDTRDALPQLSTLLLGGEALPGALAEQLRQSTPATLINMYGPTETTIWSSTHQVDQTSSIVPIGRPIANTQIYLLDGQLRPVPVGVPGELCIGGLGVVRGYHNRRDLTAEKFVPNPFGHEDVGLPMLDVGLGNDSDSIPNPTSKIQNGSRLYRTGDLARYRADGVIEFLGRIDQQVKVRGYRIELGEVEAALRQHALVRDAAVVVRTDEPGEPQLVAYIVAQGAAVSGGELRELLQAQLPEYMLPSAFVMLDALPLTPNGKIDRRALPAPDSERPDVGAAYVAPRTPVEEVLAALWSEVLGLEQIGVYDDFFELGGHSMKAAQLGARVREAFRITLPLRVLFEATTVARLAEALIRHEPRPGQTEKIAMLLKRIRNTAAGDLQTMLEQERLSRRQS